MRPYEPQPGTGQPSARLTPDAIAHLWSLGQAVRASPAGAHQDATVRLAIQTANEYRTQGVPDEAIAAALGVAPDILHQWRHAHEPKIPPGQTTPRPTAHIEPLKSPTEQPGQSIACIAYQHGSISINQSQSSSMSPRDAGTIESGLINRQPRRPVLVVSGDARPGGNDFSQEMGAIRRPLRLARVDVHEINAAELAEIAKLLDDLQPGILHVCAHSTFGGVALPLAGNPALVPHKVLWETITRASRPPQLVVLNLCRWSTTLLPDSATVETLICWPALIDDTQARIFSGVLHSGLAGGQAVRFAFDSARRATCGHWPDLEPPALRGRSDYQIF